MARFRKSLLAAGLIALGGGSAFAQPAINYTQAIVGSPPPTINFSNLSSFCVNSGVTTLPAGYAMPIPCNSSGQVITSSTGGGGGGGVVQQGALDGTAAPWEMNLWQGGTIVSTTNAVFVRPGTSATFPTSAAAGSYATGAIVDLGTTADTAWSGSGNGTLIAINKAQAASLSTIATGIRSNKVTYAALNATAIPANTAVTIITAVNTGAFFTNTSTVALTVSLHGTASATSVPLAVGQSFTVPYGTTQAVSVFNPSASVAGTVSGEQY